MAKIKVSYKNEEYEYESGVSLYDISRNFKDNYKRDIIVATINNRLSSLERTITSDCKVDFFDVNNVLGRRTYIRGLYYLFSKAVKDVLKCDVKIMYFIEKGIYCEILTNSLISEVTIEKIKIRMRELRDDDIRINRRMVSRLDAIEYFSKLKQLDKSKSLRYISNSTISLYKMGDTLDYFYGVLPYSTKYIDNFNLKYLGDNKVILLPPVTYEKEERLKFERLDNPLSEIKRQSEFLENIKINSSSSLNETIVNGNYGDIIRVSESIQNNQLMEIVNRISKNKDIKLILLSGVMESGINVTSKKLELYLKTKGYDPALISLDEFNTYDTQDEYKAENIDVNNLNTKISSLLDEEQKIIILKGTYTFDTKLTQTIPAKNKFKIYAFPITPLNIDNHNLFKETDNRLLRKIIKDNRNKVTTSDSLKQWNKIRSYEENNNQNYMKEADAIFNTSLVYELGVLKTYAEPLLFSITETDENYDDALRLINIFRVILGIPSDEVPSDSIIREFIGQSCFKDL